MSRTELITVRLCDCGTRHYKTAGDDECWECYSARQPDEYDSSTWIRCPKCRFRWGDIWEHDFASGDNTVECPECGHEFTIEVEYIVTYTSPELIQESSQELSHEPSKEPTDERN